MTESEWLESRNAFTMLPAVTRGRRRQGYAPRFPITERKLRLFAAICTRQVWDLLTDVQRVAITVAEQMADGLVAYDGDYVLSLQPMDSHLHPEWMPFRTVEKSFDYESLFANWGYCDISRRDVKAFATAADILRHIVGNPYAALPTIKPSTTLNNLAQAVYDGDQEARLPLSDALEESGYLDLAAHMREKEPCQACNGWGKERVPGGQGETDEVLCSACNPEPRRVCGFRGPDCGKGPNPLIHWKGCWVVDAVLGKE